ncbi:formate dehydrogenase accessory sulfurtransferase FdhD [Pararhizobium mangrovi]|uniref:Sulfur carrier protein FdhD n=1 Tax=Pararhizobium mangrovi TaxID=2590452 RepID=A0A506UHM7_9HYPH|nr:formate dehydrogenase accessory sulfurtransferase FdhD [Pararhizobium mangrovi]TPW32816.1 formate dehydrogenase accessory sulfurtransferase FdhD [Pararhizobium mangrovi]
MPLPEASHALSRVVWNPDAIRRGTRRVPEETPVAMSFNGSSYAVLMATPADLEDFAIGFALTEGIVSKPGEIAELEIVEVEDGIDCRMALVASADRALQARRRRMAGPVGCGLCGIETIAEAKRPVPRVGAEGFRLPAISVLDAMQGLAGHQPLHGETHAVHAAAFHTAERGIVLAREDVGRHNALDKLVGAMARNGEDASAGALAITSRVSVEMVQKAAVAGSPVLIAVSAPTALAVRTAVEAGITLLARARGSAFEVFTGAHRIEGLDTGDAPSEA